MRLGDWRHWAAAALAAAGFVLLPLATFGLAVLRAEGYVRLSALVAYEEMAAASHGPHAAHFWDAAVLYVNFTRGALNAQIYRLTVGQLVLSVTLGVLVGLNLAAARRLRQADGAMGACGFGAGGGVAATLCAATAGALGCCGGSAAVGMVALLGVSVPVAVVLGQVAGVVQAGIIVLLAGNLIRVTRRRVPPLADRLGA